MESKIKELKAKIEKAHKNTMMPENLKKQYIAKFEKELADLTKEADAAKQNDEYAKAIKNKDEKKITEIVTRGSKPKAKKEKVKSEPKKEAPKASAYDCDELIKQAKERKKAAAERAAAPKKSDLKKNTEKIEKVEDNIIKRLEKGDVKRAELERLIKETTELLNALKAALKKL